MILHTLNASPAQQAFADCLRVVAPGDHILLLGNGVYAAMSHYGSHHVAAIIMSFLKYPLAGVPSCMYCTRTPPRPASWHNWMAQ